MKTNTKSSLNISWVLFAIALSLLCLLSGAWFSTSTSKNSNGANVSFQIASFGDLSVTAEDITWTDINGNNIYTSQSLLESANDSTGIVRDSLMPGDKLVSSAITVTFDKNSTSSVKKAYYLIKYQSKFYTINSSGNMIESSQADFIDSNSPKTIGGSIVSITTDEGTYHLDGSTSSSSIDNSAQKKLLAELGAKYGVFTIGDSEQIVVAVIQYPNLTATTAYEQLISIM